MQYTPIASHGAPYSLASILSLTVVALLANHTSVLAITERAAASRVRFDVPWVLSVRPLEARELLGIYIKENALVLAEMVTRIDAMRRIK